MKRFVYLLLFLMFAQPVFSESLTIDKKSGSWARETNGFSYVEEESEQYKGLPVLRIEHQGKEDFAITCPKIAKVQPGEIYEISCYLRFRPTGRSVAAIGTVARQGQEVLSWGLGRVEVEKETDWLELKTKLIVPEDVTTLQPRFTGFGPQTVWFCGYKFEKTGKINLPKDERFQTLENSTLKVRFSEKNSTFEVLDKRTGRLWQQLKLRHSVIVRNLQKKGHRIEFELFSTATFLDYRGTLVLEENASEVIASIEAVDRNSALTGLFFWPAPFSPEENDRLVLPVNEGISFPVTEKANGIGTTHTYGGHGLCMAFWANIEDKIGEGGAGYLGIVETPDDMNLKVEQIATKKGSKPLLHPSPGWVGQLKKFGYKRQIRYCFFTKGGHVAACKRYREHAKKIGLLVPFQEKIKRNPALAKGIDLLIGSANIWYFSGDRLQIVKEMKAVGMDRLLWSAGGSGDELRKMNELGGILTSRYDIYQDLMDPANLDKVGRHSDWTQEGWPQDLNWTDSDGTLRRGWGVAPKGQDANDPKVKKLYCGVLCDSRAIPYAEKRIANELKTKPYQARFIDTTVAAPWYECYNPAHPMTRSESKKWKMKLLDLIGSRFNLVCGSETGHDASVPYCDFYEGMTSLGPYRLIHGGWTAEEFDEPTSEYVKKYQVGIDYRLPLWELVFHECTVAGYYWYDFSNRKADLWTKRDLICALYGVPPMYRLTRKIWDRQKDLFAASYKIACPTARLTGMSEMTGHRILTQDRLVQETVFANGVSVIANFSEKPFTCSDGSILPAMKSKLTVPKK